jgi:hypothetical protein
VDRSCGATARIWTRRPASPLPGVRAFDVSPQSAAAAIASAGKREDGRLHTKVVTHKPGTAWVIPRLLDLCTRYRARQVFVNGTVRPGRAGTWRPH